MNEPKNEDDAKQLADASAMMEVFFAEIRRRHRMPRHPTASQLMAEIEEHAFNAAVSATLTWMQIRGVRQDVDAAEAN
jgi:hypothetical protein